MWSTLSSSSGWTAKMVFDTAYTFLVHLYFYYCAASVACLDQWEAQ